MTQKPKKTIISDKLEVESRLFDFGLVKEDAAKICEGALHGRNLSTGLQPRTAEGLLKYIFGVEALRVTCQSSEIVEYEIFSKSNIEGVYDPVNGRKIMFQMVDQACGTVEPQPKSKIGDGKEKFIRESGCGWLFPELAEDEKIQVAKANSLQKAECWYLMMSIDTNDTVCCELSHPKTVEENKFDGFHERIQIFKYGEFEPAGSSLYDDGDNDTFEIKPTIQKK